MTCIRYELNIAAKNKDFESFKSLYSEKCTTDLADCYIFT
jgi:hypothetical protein